MKLRPYQEEFVNSSIKVMSQHRSALGVMATGLGKTVAFAHIAKHYLEQGKVLVLAHRTELIFQACATLRKITGVEPEIEMGDMRASNKARLIVSTFQTQYSGKVPRYTRFNADDFALVISDEAHHVIAKSFSDVIAHYLANKGCHTLGVTATPDRSDGLAMGKVYNSVAYNYGIREGIDDGWLVPIRAEMHQINGLDLSVVNTHINFWGEEDFSKKDLDRVLSEDKNVAAFAYGIIQADNGKQGVVFCAGVTQAEKITDILNSQQPGSAVCIFGKTKRGERAEKVSAFKRGEHKWLVNVQVATEGFDAPAIGNVYLCVPTKSRSLYAQMAGRGTRSTVDLNGLTADDRHKAIAESDKPFMRLVDFSGSSGKLKLVSPADILGGDYSDAVKDALFKVLEKGEKSIEEALSEAEAIVEEQERKAEEKLKHKIAKLIKEGKVLTVLDVSKIPVNPFDLFDIHQDTALVKAERGERATDAQRGFLEKHNIDTSGLTKREAGQAIDKLATELEKPSEKQLSAIRKYGYPHDLSLITKELATKYMAKLAYQKWKPKNEYGKYFWE